MPALRVYDMEINDNDETGVDINSFVNAPAHLRSFEVYGKLKERYKVNEEKRMVTGVFILANTQIYRNDNQLGEHFVQFKPDVIEKIRNKFFEQGYNTNTNIEHKVMVQGATLVESYIVDSRNPRAPKVPDALSKQGVTDGSWIGSYKIKNEVLWQDCKNGTFTGFSVEGYFDKVQTKTKNSVMNKNKDKKPSWWKEIFGSKEELSEVTTVDGTVLTYDGDLKEGTIMMGADGKPAKAGDYQCELDGKTYAITLDDTGAITSMSEVTAMSENEEALADAVKKVNDDMKAGFAQMMKVIGEKDARIKSLEDFLTKEGKFTAKGKKTDKDDEEGTGKKKNFRDALK